ncbi:response regulator [Paenibacillus rigui]|uniref:DNA-binding response regulator n=1 Tax=Paenibacillus rigui TaxID=554312 RepID=A0A229UJ56_9BACL|nr:response regulator [Paenibacillus rigui]OXM83404.1 DNA-binding response regulator [Paenibacillus rigui]
MYKLIIVDDEPTVRYGLRNYFQWSDFGIEVIDEADDGLTGLALAERTRPDIVLTDVRMLHMDGIQMASQIRSSYPQTKIVFVSGHDDVDYMKSALQVNAVDYIFKPVNMQELHKVVERVMGELEEERKERRLIADMQEKLTQSMPLLREKFLMSLIRDGIQQPHRIQDRLDFLGLQLPEEAPYWVIIVQIDDNADVVDGRSERDKQLLAYAVLNVCQELVERYMNGYAFENRSGEYVCILYGGEEREGLDLEDPLVMLAGDIRENLAQWLKISVTIGVGERISKLAALPLSYTRAREAADQKWYLGKNRIITMDSLETDEESPYRFDSSQHERFLSALKAGEQGPLFQELEVWFARVARNRKDGIHYGKIFSLELILLANRLMLEFNIHDAELERKGTDLWSRINKQETIRDVRTLLEAHLLEVCNRVQDKRSGKSRHVIERIRAVMEQRYAENLTVSDVAESVYLSSTYVSLLFKQETGETVYEYLTKVRIERAKEMLRDPRVKFYEVSEAVGYADPSHFSKIFKKYTGWTPSGYRDQMT